VLHFGIFSTDALSVSASATLKHQYSRGGNARSNQQDNAEETSTKTGQKMHSASQSETSLASIHRSTPCPSWPRAASIRPTAAARDLPSFLTEYCRRKVVHQQPCSVSAHYPFPCTRSLPRLFASARGSLLFPRITQACKQKAGRLRTKFSMESRRNKT